MAAQEPQKTTVLIVGSGLTGLTLALMFQKLNIDYILLEAYDSCTPNVGASLAVQPQGMRILDQLGLHEEIAALYQPSDVAYLIDGDSGKLTTSNPTPILASRHGYTPGFFNRHQLLCVLHSHITDQAHRLRTNHKVVRVDSLDDRAVVHTAAGHVFEAQLVVGADGVRSAVRREMWRNAGIDKEQPIPCNWGTCYGVSDYGSHLPRGHAGCVTGDGWNAGWMCGKEGKTFTFWSFQMPKDQRTTTYNTIPRFTAADHEREIERAKEILRRMPKKHGIDLDWDKLYDQRDPRHSGITALPHFVLDKWHHGRIVVIGDAAHKFNPFPGQGGMNCLVSAATLVNTLRDTLSTPTFASSSWPLAPLDAAFTTLAALRVTDVRDAVVSSEDAMNLMGWASTGEKIAYKMLLPLMPDTVAASAASKIIKRGTVVKGWKVPAREHSMLYADEEDKTQQVRRWGAGSMGMAMAVVVGGVLVGKMVRERPGLVMESWKALKDLVVAK